MLQSIKRESVLKKGLIILLAFVLMLSTLAISPAEARAVTAPGADIPVGNLPQAVAMNPVTNKVYVANMNSDSVTVIDGANNSTQTVAVGSHPQAIAVNPATNKVYVANRDGASVTVIDGADNSTQTVAIGYYPQAIAVNPVTNKVYVANMNSNSVTVIDGADHSMQTIAVGNNPYAVAVNPVTNKVYVANIGGRSVTVIDGSDNSMQTVTAGDYPNAVAVNPVTNKVYVANLRDKSVTVIDGTNNATQTIAVGEYTGALSVNPVTNIVYVLSGENVTVIDGSDNTTQTVAVGDNPSSVVVNPITNKVYVANQSSSSIVTVIDGSDNSTQTVAMGNVPFAAAVNPVTNKVYVASAVSGTVTVIDGSDNATQTIATERFPQAVAVNPAANKIYTANSFDGSVTVIDGSDNSAQTVAAGWYPRAVAVNPVTDKAYVLNQDSDTVTVIASDNTTQTVTVGEQPMGVAVNPVTNKVYVPNGVSDTVTVIDGSDNSTQTVTAGGFPYAVAVNPVTNKVYVPNANDNTVTVIDGSDNSTQSVAVGQYPVAVAVNPETNKVYVLNQGGDNVTVIDGSDNSTQTVAAGTDPRALAINTVTNRVYVLNEHDDNVTVIDGSDNSTQTVTVGDNPKAVAVNPATNKVYVSNSYSDTVTVIDGSDNSTQTITVEDCPQAVAVNPVTNKAYVANSDSNTVTVIDETGWQQGKLKTSIAPLPGNATASTTPVFHFNASSAYSPTAPDIRQIYYQVDTCTGEWKEASMSGDSASATLSSLTKGSHVLYAFAADGMDATSINTGNGNSAIIGSIEAYAFTIADTPIITTASIPDGILQNDYSADIDATDGIEPYTWSATGLPAGLSIDTDTGRISGKPEESGTFTPYITVVDDVGLSTSKTFSIDIDAMPDGSGALAVASSSVNPGSKNNDFVVTYTPTTSGMYMGEITLQIPAGFTLPTTASGSGGYVTSTAGTVSVSGQTITVSDIVLAYGDTFDITYSDVSAPTSPGTYTLLSKQKTLASGTLKLISPQPQIVVTSDTSAILKINTNALPGAAAGESYSTNLSASGGETPYTWSATGLPKGLSISVSSGEISGKPLKAGTYEVGIVVKDADGDKAYKDLSLTVAAQTIKAKYKAVPDTDAAYTVGYTAEGSAKMTMGSAASGFRFFTVTVEMIVTNEGDEVAVFTLTRNGVQFGFSAVKADFDVNSGAAVGFNVKPGDVIKVYIVDELSNDAGNNPVLLQ